MKWRPKGRAILEEAGVPATGSHSNAARSCDTSDKGTMFASRCRTVTSMNPAGVRSRSSLPGVHPRSTAERQPEIPSRR